MKNALKEIITGFNSLVTGMRITLGQFFKPTVTVHYPHESLKMPKRFRGHIELVRDEQTGFAKCYVCKLCEKACPSDCITVEGIKPEGFKRRTVTSYRLDFTKCSLCGSCVEACREGCIRFSREFNLASTNKDDFVMNLFKRLEAEAAAEGRPLPPIPPPAAPAAPAPKSQISNLKSESSPAASSSGASSAVSAAPAAVSAPRPSPSASPPSPPQTQSSLPAEVAK